MAPLAAILAVAGLNLTWGLGASSLFVDEVYSWRAASVPLGELFHRVRFDEVAPPTYYVFLHEWIGRLGSQAEWVMRLPSALAGIALVGATYWLGSLVGGRRVAALAALLAALSPLVLEYAQQARAYIWAALAATLAVGAAIRAEQVGPARRRWLIAAALLAGLSLWLHYTALLVIAPLTAWLLTRATLPSRARLGFGLAIAALGAGVLPLATDQLGRGHQEGVAPSARLTETNLYAVIGTPFDGRPVETTAFHLIGGAVIVAAALLLLRARIPHRGLLLLLTAAPPLALVVLTLVGDDILITRYSAVAAPVMLVAIASAVITAPRPLVPLLLGAALVLAVVGTVASHRRGGYYDDTRAAVEKAAGGWRPNDALVPQGYAAIPLNLEYYATRLLPAGAFVAYDRDLARQSFARRQRIWLVSGPPSVPPDQLAAGFRRGRYRLLETHVLDHGRGSLQVSLAQPSTERLP